MTEASGLRMVRAIEADLEASWASLVRGPSAELLQTPEMTRVLTGLQRPFFNNVTRTQLDPEQADAKIQETVAYFAARQAPMCWWVGPSARPDDLGERLEAHGLTRTGEKPGMAADLRQLNKRTPTPPGLTIKRVNDEATMRELVHTVIIQTGMAPSLEESIYQLLAGPLLGRDERWRYYLGQLDGQPVGTSSMFLGAGVAGIYMVGTVPEARRQGIGNALSLAPLLEAKELGYHIGTLQSSEMGYGVYRRMGFKEYFRFGYYERSG